MPTHTHDTKHIANTCCIPQSAQHMVKWLASQQAVDVVDIGSISRTCLQMAAYHDILSPRPEFGGQNATYDRRQNVERGGSFPTIRLVSRLYFASIASGRLNRVQPGWDVARQAIRFGQVPRREKEPPAQQEVSGERNVLSLCAGRSARSISALRGDEQKCVAALRHAYTHFIEICADKNGMGREAQKTRFIPIANDTGNNGDRRRGVQSRNLLDTVLSRSGGATLQHSKNRKNTCSQRGFRYSADCSRIKNVRRRDYQSALHKKDTWAQSGQPVGGRSRWILPVAGKLPQWVPVQEAVSGQLNSSSVAQQANPRIGTSQVSPAAHRYLIAIIASFRHELQRFATKTNAMTGKRVAGGEWK
jgi:hypothetical protein